MVEWGAEAREGERRERELSGFVVRAGLQPGRRELTQTNGVDTRREGDALDPNLPSGLEGIPAHRRVDVMHVLVRQLAPTPLASLAAPLRLSQSSPPLHCLSPQDSLPQKTYLLWLIAQQRPVRILGVLQTVHGSKVNEGITPINRLAELGLVGQVDSLVLVPVGAVFGSSSGIGYMLVLRGDVERDDAVSHVQGLFDDSAAYDTVGARDGDLELVGHRFRYGSDV